MPFEKEFIQEVIVVGLGTLILGLVVRYIVAVYFEKINADFIFTNKGMWISLFLTGALLHLGCEISGVNKWYCKNGFACK